MSVGHPKFVEEGKYWNRGSFDCAGRKGRGLLR